MVKYINACMSIPARLWLMVIVSAIPDVLLTGLYVQQSSIDIAFAQKEADGTDYLTGLWGHYLKLARTEETAAPAPTSEAYDREFNAGDASKAYSGASDLIEKLDAGKALIGAVADGSNLTLDPDLDSFYAMDADTVRLPGIVAAAIQLRKAAAESRRDQARVVHIAFALNRLEISAGDAVSSLNASMKNNAAGRTRSALSGLTKELTTASAAVAAQGHALLDGGKAEGLDGTIDRLLEQTDTTWAATNLELARLLDVRIQGFHRKLVINLIVAAAALIVSAWLSKTISVGLSQRVTQLVAVMKRLIANDVTPTIPYLDDTNETGQIAKTLAAFKGSVVERKRLESEQATASETTQVVSSIACALDELARGNLAAMLPDAFPPAYDKIRVDLNATISTLRASMLTIAGSAEAIRSSTSGIAEASSDVAQRTDEQALALQASASALDEVTATIHTSAQEAMVVHEIISSVHTTATRSGKIVRDAVTAMKGIEASSQEIGAVIGVMDEIASQTNLLALNATIEAARAGESGRGFTVVATEVRSLAERSAKAAQQVRELILSAAAQVDQGSNLVAETGKALEGIIRQIGETTDLMTAIASGAATQAEKLQQVNNAIAEMDEATRRNTEMVDATTQAAQALKKETERLGALVGNFKIDVDLPFSAAA